MNLVGDLKVLAIRNGKVDYYKVESVDEGKNLIDDLAKADLKNDAIDFNFFELLVYEGASDYCEDGWVEWANGDGETLDEIEIRTKQRL